MKNKKGDVIPFILYVLIIFAFIMVLYLLLGGDINAYMKSYFEKLTCKKSVEMHSRLHVGGIEAFSDVNCPVRYKEVKKGSDINHALAFYMAECWDQYGEGRLKLFSNEWISTEKFCAICTHLKFDENKVIDAKSFLQYLKEKPAPIGFTYDVFGNKGVSYYTYLSGYKTEDLDLSNPKLGEYKIDTDKPYGIIFTYTKRGDLVSDYTLKAAGVGAIIGSTTGEAMVLSIKGIPFIGKAISGKAIMAIGLAGVVGGAYAAVRLGGVPQQIDSAVVLIPYDEIELQKLDCEIFPVKPSIKKEK